MLCQGRPHKSLKSSITILNCGDRAWQELFSLECCLQAVFAWKRLPFATTGPRLLPAPPQRPPVPDLLGWNPKIQGQRASLSFLRQWMCLLREEHRPLTCKKEVCDGPTHPGADRRRAPSAATGARVWGRGMRIFRNDETDVTVINLNFYLDCKTHVHAQAPPRYPHVNEQHLHWRATKA